MSPLLTRSTPERAPKQNRKPLEGIEPAHTPSLPGSPVVPPHYPTSLVDAPMASEPKRSTLLAPPIILVGTQAKLTKSVAWLVRRGVIHGATLAHFLDSSHPRREIGPVLRTGGCFLGSSDPQVIHQKTSDSTCCFLQGAPVEFPYLADPMPAKPMGRRSLAFHLSLWFLL